MDVIDMSYDDCVAVIRRHWLARLACVEGDTPYVVPVQYAWSGENFYLFTLPGRKLQAMKRNPKVCLQIDQLKNRRSWKSVVAETEFRDLSDEDCREEREQAWSLLARNFDWWQPGALKPPGKSKSDRRQNHIFFALEIIELSGRKTAG